MIIGHVLVKFFAITPLSSLFQHHTLNIIILILIAANLISLYFVLDYKHSNRLLRSKIEGIWTKMEKGHKRKIEEKDVLINELENELRTCHKEKAALAAKLNKRKKEIEKLSRELRSARTKLAEYKKDQEEVFVEFYVDKSRSANKRSSQ